MSVRQPLAPVCRCALVRATWLLARVITIWLALVGSSHAEPADPLAKPAHPQAREHLARGNKLYAVREFARAIAEYKAGALLEDATVFQYNLAQCYRLLGNHEEALWHYERFLKRAQPQEPLRSTVLQFIEQQRAARAQAAEAATSSPVASATAPSPRAVTARPKARHWTDDRLGWTLVGTGAVLSATSGVLLVLARSLEREGNAEPIESNRADLRDRAQTRRVAGYLAGGLGVISLGAGGMRLWLHGDGQSVVGAAVAGTF